VIVIDTHVLCWWASGDEARLSAAAASSLEQARHDGTIYVSCISAWEIAMLVQKNRLVLASDTSQWLATVSQIRSVSFVPLDNEIAVLSTRFGPEFHKDPADRFIVATAVKLMLPLVTADEKLRAFDGVRTIW
jgi:PIN domain nuclease of toxin-antitoxin system